MNRSINSLKASGVYRILIDKSQTISNASQYIPLVIGFSKRGLFNTPTLCPDTDYFISIFGGIDKSLERRGSFFHRSCLTLLEEGPIYALNLYDLENEYPSNINTISLSDPNYDLTRFKGVSTSASAQNTPLENRPYSIFYNRQQFWFPDTEEFIATAGSSPSSRNLLNMVNLSQKSITVIARKTTDTSFDVTARDWYGSGNVPEFMADTDFISDYFLDIFVIEGDWTDYVKLAVDPIYGKYFDSQKGVRKQFLQEFINLAEVNLLNSYLVSLIPDFIDKNGKNYFIESVINPDLYLTGLFVAVDKERFDNEFLSGDGVDLIGHSIESETNFNGMNSIDFLSYSESLIEDLQYAQDIMTPDIVVAPGSFIYYTLSVNPATEISVQGNILRIGVSTPEYTALLGLANPLTDLLEDSYVIDFGSTLTKILQVSTVNPSYVALSLDATKTISLVNTLEIYVNPTGVERRGTGGIGDEYYIRTIEGSSLYNDIRDGIIAQGDKVEYSVGAFGFIKIDRIADGDFNTPSFVRYAYEIKLYDDNVFTNRLDMPAFGSYLNGEGVLVPFDAYFISLSDSINLTIPVTINATNANEVTIDNTGGIWTGKIKVGQYLVSDIGSATVKSRLARITKIATSGTNLIVTCNAPIYKYNISGINAEVERYKGVEEFVQFYNAVHLVGFRLKERHFPNVDSGEVNIYNVLTSTNIQNALIDKDSISFRYVVDTFNKGLTPSSKATLTKLAYSRENAFAIMNAPSIKEFIDSTNPIFTNVRTASNPKPDLRVDYIVSGGNLEANPSVVYSLPSESDGASFGAFFTPNLIIKENLRDISVPPAAYVAKNFIRKLKSGQPWDIIAWTRRGVISGAGIVGLEYNFTEKDREYLEPFGLNPIINKRNVGLMITSNSTAKQVIKSSLSDIHATETAIFIQDGIANILKDFVWEFNTSQTRLEVKTLADQFLEQVKIAGGIYDYQNIMNETNNTTQLIDEKKGILDSYIEIVKGLGIIIHRTTILKTGQISTGTFL